MATVEDTPFHIGSGPMLIQNLGPDPLYIGGANPTSADGFKVSAGETVSMLYTNAASSVISDGTSDVRILHGGSSFSGSPASSPE